MRLPVWDTPRCYTNFIVDNTTQGDTILFGIDLLVMTGNVFITGEDAAIQEDIVIVKRATTPIHPIPKKKDSDDSTNSSVAYDRVAKAVFNIPIKTSVLGSNNNKNSDIEEAVKKAISACRKTPRGLPTYDDLEPVKKPNIPSKDHKKPHYSTWNPRSFKSVQDPEVPDRLYRLQYLPYIWTRYPQYP